VRAETVEAFLAQLAARVPAPGGATAALHADVAAAAEAARAAAVTARVNIEVNLRGIMDAAIKNELSATAAATDEITARADRIVAAVRDEITR